MQGGESSGLQGCTEERVGNVIDWHLLKLHQDHSIFQIKGGGGSFYFVFQRPDFVLFCFISDLVSPFEHEMFNTNDEY